MANARRAVEQYLSIAQIEADPGPIVPHYATTLDVPRLFQWIPGDTTTADSAVVLSHTGGTAGRWHLVRQDDIGVALTDADATITIAQGETRVLPVSTLTAARVLTLSDTNAVAGDYLTITRLDVEAFTYQIDDLAGTSTITTLPASQRWFADFRFDGTNWQIVRAGQMP